MSRNLDGEQVSVACEGHLRVTHAREIEEPILSIGEYEYLRSKGAEGRKGVPRLGYFHSTLGRIVASRLWI